MANEEAMEPVYEEVVKWKTLSLTHVEYPEGDKVGKYFAIYSLAPLVIAIVLATLFVSRRDLHTATLGVGVILNHILNQVLKKMYAEPRPVIRAVVLEEHGWPSNHSQYMWFVCIYAVLFIQCRLHFRWSWSEVAWKLLAISGSLAAAVVMSYSRVYLQYHTVDQVVAGSVIGSISAVVWFLVTQYCLTPYFQTITGWRISEFLLIRDCTPIPNVMWFEYLSTRGEAAKRKKKERKVQ
eukprot:TRINITY_DN7133_c0_g1_i2.p1 TRINITY_DN7133_c0_g1~~TRINITY_DN7133_c0_g1_i2.p1  ORF type:complete len:238 (-),score=14.61 TRINITY_DN7133_c0_g1_i2:180-893(-)